MAGVANLDNRHDCRRGQKDEKRHEPLSEIEAGTGGVAAPTPETPPPATVSPVICAPCEGRTEKLTTSQKVRQLIPDKDDLLIGAGSNLPLEESNGGRPSSGAASIANEGSGVVDRGGGNGLLAGALDLGHYCAHRAYTRDLIGPAGSDDGGARSSRGRNGDRSSDMD